MYLLELFCCITLLFIVADTAHDFQTDTRLFKARQDLLDVFILLYLYYHRKQIKV